MSKKFSEAGFPAPNQYDDWRSWAASFLVALDSLSNEEVHNFPLYKRNPEKAREGLPAGVDGDMIRVLDTDDQQRLYVFESGSWEKAQEDILKNLDYVVEWKFATADDPTWYRVYKSGWVEQGGKIPYQDSSKDVSVVLPKEMLDTNYIFSGCCVYSSNADTDHRESTNELASKTTTGFTKYIWTKWQDFCWQVSGQGATL